MTDLRPLLDALVSEHDRAGSPLRDHLRPGLPAGEVAAQLQQAGLTPAREAMALFEWHDGIDQASWQRAAPGARGLELFPYAFFQDLAYGLDARRRMQSLADESREAGVDQPGDPPWRSLLPIFDADPGWYLLECAGDLPDTPVWVMYWDSTVDDPTRIVYPNLEAMIAALIARFRAGAYVWSPEHDRLLADESILAKTFGQTRHAVEDRRA